MSECARKTLLLVEDEAVLAMTEKLELEKYGYAVKTVNTGEKAVEAVRTILGIDLVLMDINLGNGIDGTQAAEIILRDHDIPIVFVSSHCEREVVEKTEKITSYGYVVKNSSITVLDASIKMAFKLFEAKNVYKDTFDFSINGLCIHKMLFNESNNPWDCEYIHVNSEFEKQTGLTFETVVGKTIRDLYPSNEADDVIDLYINVMKTSTPTRKEIFFEPKGKWYFLSVFPLHDNMFTVAVQDITERKTNEEKTDRQHKNLLEINRIGRLVNSATDLDTLLNLVLEQTVQSLRASAGMIFLNDVDTGTLIWGASLGLSDEFIKEFREVPIKLGEGLTGRIAESGEPIYISEDSSHDPRIARSVIHREGLNSFIGVPILADEKIVGVMNILTRPPLLLSEEAVHFCSAIGMQVGWAINNALLYANQTKLEKQLLRNEKLNHAFIEYSPYGVKLINNEGRILKVNQAACEMIGYSRDELLSLTVSDIDPDWDKDRFMRFWDDKPFDDNAYIETYHRHKSGKLIPVEVRVIRFELDGEQLIYGISQDISERKKAEEALRKSEERFKYAVNASNDGLWDWNLETNDIYYSPRWKSILGYEDHEIPNDFSVWETTTDPEDVKKSWEMQQKLITKQIDRFVVEFKMKHKDGHWVEILSQATAIFDDKGKAIRIVGTHTDISERKHAEEALQESEAKFKAMVETFPLAIHQSAGVDQITEYMNPTMVKMFGYTQADIPSVAAWWPLAYPDETYRRQIAEEWTKKVKQAIATQSSIEPMEVVCTCKDGSKKNILWGYITLGDKNYSCGLDITERKLSDKRIKALLEEKELVLKEVHHRIKNNMNTVGSLLSLQAQMLTEPSAITALNDAEARLQSMSVLYDTLYQSADYTTVSVKVYLPVLVDEIVANFPNSQIVKVEKEIEDFILDAKHLQPLGIIINELLTNIMKYAFKGRESGLITVSATKTKDHIVISVQDDGVGVPESITFGNNSGFGLQLVQALTQQLNGMIRMERGNGTKVVLEFDV